MPGMILKCTQLPLVFQLKPGLNRLGRHPDNDFEVSDASISSFHCEIQVSGDSIYVRDLGSTNGTFLQNQPVKEGILKRGDFLRLGSIDFQFEPDANPAPLPNVSIPKMEVEQPKTHGFLADGCPACLHHEETPASYECTQCHETFCANCVRSLSVAKHRKMVFCPACDGQCSAIIMDKSRSKKSIFVRITETLKLPFGR